MLNTSDHYHSDITTLIVSNPISSDYPYRVLSTPLASFDYPSRPHPSPLASDYSFRLPLPARVRSTRPISTTHGHSTQPRPFYRLAFTHRAYSLPTSHLPSRLIVSDNTNQLSTARLSSVLTIRLGPVRNESTPTTQNYSTPLASLPTTSIFTIGSGVGFCSQSSRKNSACTAHRPE